MAETQVTGGQEFSGDGGRKGGRIRRGGCGCVVWWFGCESSGSKPQVRTGSTGAMIQDLAKERRVSRHERLGGD